MQGYSFKDDGATVKEITLEFIDVPEWDITAYVSPNFSSTDGSVSRADRLTLTVNIAKFKNISVSDTTHPCSHGGKD
ncbi:MAG: hypothetical protein SR3Q1_07985 [Quinella sp. 3Q1]|nr:hypothetical protein [Quinella sp. 3Q1]MBR6888872.1 hypothetical protein [Selenomonadaceae bacterium]